MSLLRNVKTGLRSLFRKDQVDRELDEELRAYQEMAAEEKIRDGMSRSEALRAVRLERGSLQVSKEIVRAGGWESFVQTCWQDGRFAARMLQKNPTFALAAILTLALGIGATAAVFSVVDTVVLRPLSYADSSRLVMIDEWTPSLASIPVSGLHFQEWRRGAKSFEGIAYRRRERQRDRLWRTGASPRRRSFARLISVARGSTGTGSYLYQRRRRSRPRSRRDHQQRIMAQSLFR